MYELSCIPECKLETDEEDGGDEDDLEQEHQQLPTMVHGLVDPNIETALASIFAEREKLEQKLQETEDKLDTSQSKLREVERRHELLWNELRNNTNQETSCLVHDLVFNKELLADRDEEIEDLKAERRNTRLLLEHLEGLVGQHERSVRTTVIKRHQAYQQQQGGGQYQGSEGTGVASEVEILKALRSLFVHHKALDEKVREKLKVAQEKCIRLEKELERAKQLEVTKSINEDVDSSKSKQDTEDEKEESLTQSAEPDEIAHYKRTLEESQAKITEMEKRLSDKQTSLEELETEVHLQRKKADEACERKLELEHRVANVEERLISAQRDAGYSHEMIAKLEASVSAKDVTINHIEQKYAMMKERCELLSQRVGYGMNNGTDSAKNQKMIEIVNESKSSIFAKPDNPSAIEERLQQTIAELRESNAELVRAKQRETMKEEHNERLTAAIDKLLTESNEHAQLQLEERVHAIEERNKIAIECDNLRRRLDASVSQKSKLFDKLNVLNNELQLVKSRADDFQGSVKNRSLWNVSGMSTMADESLVYQCADSMDWEASLQNNVNIVDDVREAFESSEMIASPQRLGGSKRTDPQRFLFPSYNQTEISKPSRFLPPTSIDTKGDVQSLASMLQQQLDAINREMRRLELERADADRRADQLKLEMVANSSPGATSAFRNRGPSNYCCGGSQDPVTRSPTTNIMIPASSSPATINDFHYSGHPDQTIYHYHPQQQHHHDCATLHDSMRVYRRTRNRSSPPHPSMVRAVSKGPHYINCRSPFNSDFTDVLKFPCGHHHQDNGTPVTYGSLRLAQRKQDPLMEVVLDNDSKSDIYDEKDRQMTPIPSMFSSLKKRSTGAAVIKNSLGRLFRSGGRWNDRMTADTVVNQHDHELSSSYQQDISQQQQQQQQQPQQQQPAFCEIAKSDHHNSDEGIDAIRPLTSEFNRRMMKKQELLDEALNSRIPFERWDTATVVAWLELWVGMPAWYVAACRANVKSGAIMAALSETEIHREIGISNPLHRMKLRLAIAEIVNFTSSSSTPKSDIIAFKEMNHEWMGNEWLGTLGLRQYRSSFMSSLVDARMLSNLTKKDLRNYLKMIDSFHRNSLFWGISVLQRYNYNKSEIEKRRTNCDEENTDVVVWSNDRVIRWVNAIGLKEYSSNLVESGVHGGLLALDPQFDWKTLLGKMQIPTSNNQARQSLQHHFEQLQLDNSAPSSQSTPTSRQHNQQSSPSDTER